MSFVDLTGRHPLTVMDSPVLVPGPWGEEAASFNVNAWITTQLSEADFSFYGVGACIEFMFRATGGALVLPLLGTRQAVDTGYTGWAVRLNNNEVQILTRYASSVGSWSASTSLGLNLRDGAVHAVTIQYSAADALEVWVDGQRGLALSLDGFADPGHLYVGSYPDEWGGDGAFDISHLRITRGALRHPSGPTIPIVKPQAGAAIDPLWGSVVFAFLMRLVVLTDAPTHRLGDIKTFFFDLTTTADYALDGLLLATDDGLTTAVVLSLFTDARAEADDPIPQGDTDRRGWWGDAWPMVPGESMGSRLWLAWPGKQTADNLARAREAAEDALRWLVDDGIARAVTVQATNPRAGVLALAVSIERPDGEALSLRFESLWS